MKKNKKGFTLVELLAVIVVLAIIMIIAVPQVLNAMDDARKSTFTIEARKAIEAGMSQRQADELAGNINKSVTGSLTGTGNDAYYCYTFAKVGLDTGGKYHGTLRFYVNKNGETEFRFTTKPADTLLSIEVFNANNEPGKRYIKL